MKRKKNLLILAGLLVLLCVVAIAEFAVNRHEDKIKNTDEEVLAIDEDDVTEVSWNYEDKDLDFKKEDGKWISTDDETFPVNQDTMSSFLSNFASVKASFVIDDVDDYDQYGLSNPECTLKISTKDDTKTILMGGYSSMDSKRYISMDDGKVYLIDTDLLESMSSDRDHFMQQDELGNFSVVDSFKVSGDNELDIVYDEKKHSYSDQYSYYLVKGDQYKPVSDDNAEAYESNVTGMNLTDYVTYNANAGDLEKYNLDDPLMSVAVTGTAVKDTAEDTTEETTAADTESSEESDEYSDDDSYSDDETYTDDESYTDTTEGSSSNTVATDEDTKEDNTVDKSYTLNISKKGNKYYANVDGSSIIYHLDSDVYDSLKSASYNTLRPSEVFALDWSKVSSVKFHLDDKDYTIDVTHRGDENTYKLDGEKVEFDDVTAAVDALTIEKFNQKKPEKELEMSMTITVESDDDKTTEELPVEIYQYDGSDCLVVYDGETMGLMQRSLMVTLKEAVQTIVLNQ